VKPFLLADELQKLFGDETVLKSDGNSVLYLDYSGTFDFDVPEIAASLDENDLRQGITPVTVSIIPPASAKITAAIAIAPTATLAYRIPKPDIEANSEWTLTVDSVGFTNSALNANFKFDFIVDDRGTKSKLKAVFTFPPEFVLSSGKTVTKEIELVTNQNEYTVSLDGLSGFNSANVISNVSYRVELIPGTDTYVSRNGSVVPRFNMALFVTNPALRIIKTRITMSEYDVANDKISIRDLSEAFEGEGKIALANPSLNITVNTNLNIGLEVVMNKIDALKNGTPFYTITNDYPMNISENTSLYLYAAENDGSVTPDYFIPLDISSLIAKKPDEIGYLFKTKPLTGKIVYLQPGNIQASADYLFKIPLSFNELKLYLEPIILEDVFDDGMAEDIFKENSGSVTISADTVLVDIVDNNSDLHIYFNIAYLDEYKNVISGKNQTLLAGINKLEFTEDNLANLKNARHIQFSVQIDKEENGHPLTLTNKDKIIIRKLKIKKAGGLPIDL
jgi:hypothetical protein